MYNKKTIRDGRTGHEKTIRALSDAKYVFGIGELKISCIMNKRGGWQCL